MNMDPIELDQLIDRAIKETRSRTKQMILDLATQYHELDQNGIFAIILAQYAIYLVAAVHGPAHARHLAEEGIIAFEYDQPESHAPCRCH